MGRGLEGLVTYLLVGSPAHAACACACEWVAMSPWTRR